MARDQRQPQTQARDLSQPQNDACHSVTHLGSAAPPRACKNCQTLAKHVKPAAKVWVIRFKSLTHLRQFNTIFKSRTTHQSHMVYSMLHLYSKRMTEPSL